MTSHSSGRGAGAVAGDAAVLAASAHLTGRDRYLVRMVGEHRVLTTDQLAALGFGNVITARHRLGVLVRLGMLRRFRPHREVGSARGITCSAPSAPRCWPPKTATIRNGCRRSAPTASWRWCSRSDWRT
jgi:protein involved in plasmid replication-relaxation